MEKLLLTDLMSLEEYALARKDFQQYIATHKKHRLIPLTPQIHLLFEDKETVQYQIQETLHTECLFIEDEVQHELTLYNSLIPDGYNFKASLIKANITHDTYQLIEAVWLQVGEAEKIFSRHTQPHQEITPSYLQFNLTPSMCLALKKGASIQMGITHPAMSVSLIISEASRQALIQDIKA